AEALPRRQDEVLAANERDLAQAREAGLGPAQVDRLRLTPSRLAACADGLRQVAALPDPVGQVRSSTCRPNGLEGHKGGVPLGVILFIYESRPNVTLDAAALCVKSGNAVLLRGGREALHSNVALHRLLAEALAEVGLPAEAVQLVATPDRAAVGHLLRLDHLIDLAIPRGGEGPIRPGAEEARMPVRKHYKGVCHVFVERSAEPEMALRIVLNAKCQRPGVCNAAECLLVDAPLAESFLPRAAEALRGRGVQLRGCDRTCRLVPWATPATEEDYATEDLDLVMSVRVVAGVSEAGEDIARFGSGHSDALATPGLRGARRGSNRGES